MKPCGRPVSCPHFPAISESLLVLFNDVFHQVRLTSILHDRIIPSFKPFNLFYTSRNWLHFTRKASLHALVTSRDFFFCSYFLRSLIQRGVLYSQWIPTTVVVLSVPLNHEHPDCNVMTAPSSRVQIY